MSETNWARPKDSEHPVWPVHRGRIIDYLAGRFNHKIYLEIGIHNGANFNSLQHPFRRKVGVDPDPLASPVTYRCKSDTFFELSPDKYDLIFIDGLHEHKQVYKDVRNALACLSAGGTVVMHD